MPNHSRAVRRYNSWPAHGIRPSMAPLLDIVMDQPAGARARTLTILQDMVTAGVELDEQAITIAAKLGSLACPSDAVKTPMPTLVSLTSDSIVYYIRRGDLIKIGTTVAPRIRFGSLMPDEILAFEPGDRDTERARHRQFAHLRAAAGSEYFRPALDLLQHIQQVADAYGEPPPDWPTTKSAARPWLPRPGEPVSGETLTITQASKRFGVKRATIQQWARRRRIFAAGVDEHGYRVFYADQFRTLAEAHRART